MAMTNLLKIYERWQGRSAKDKHVKRFAVLVGYTSQRDQEREDQLEVNVQAAERMALLHDELLVHGYEGHDLEIYLVRLLFCLFAGDTGIFPKGKFYDYIANSKEDGSDLSHRVKADTKLLNQFHDRIAKLKFLDPACGCGNFLMIAYRELRLLAVYPVSAPVSEAERESLPESRRCPTVACRAGQYPCRAPLTGAYHDAMSE